MITVGLADGLDLGPCALHALGPEKGHGVLRFQGGQFFPLAAGQPIQFAGKEAAGEQDAAAQGQGGRPA